MSLFDCGFFRGRSLFLSLSLSLSDLSTNSSLFPFAAPSRLDLSRLCFAQTLLASSSGAMAPQQQQQECQLAPPSSMANGSGGGGSSQFSFLQGLCNNQAEDSTAQAQPQQPAANASAFSQAGPSNTMMQQQNQQQQFLDPNLLLNLQKLLGENIRANNTINSSGTSVGTSAFGVAGAPSGNNNYQASSSQNALQQLLAQSLTGGSASHDHQQQQQQQQIMTLAHLFGNAPQQQQQPPPRQPQPSMNENASVPSSNAAVTNALMKLFQNGGNVSNCMFFFSCVKLSCSS